MGNITSYAYSEWRSFDEKPFCEADSLIFARLAYLHFPKMCMGKTDSAVKIVDIFRFDILDEMLSVTTMKEQVVELLTGLAANPRFRNVEISRYVYKTEKEDNMQFAAVTFRTKPGQYYISFRGTDRSFTGWKEDLYLVLEKPIESQLEAVKYLEMIAGETEGEIILGGHSKGGNLAVYSGAMCSENVQDRIIKIFSHDGPGFQGELKTENFLRIRNRIHKTLPQESAVGILMDQECDYDVVKSNKIGGIAQHEIFNWNIQDGELVYLKELSASSKLLGRTVNTFIDKLDDEECKKFADVIFDTLETTNTDSFDKLLDGWRTAFPQIAKEVKEMDDNTKGLLSKVIRQLRESGHENIQGLIKNNKE